MNEKLIAGQRPITIPNLSRRNNVVLTPQAVHTKPCVHGFGVQSLKQQPTTRQIPAESKTEPPKRITEIKSQNVPKTVQVNYVASPAPPDQLDRIRRIRWSGRGKALIIVGNGPSITEAPLQLLSGHDRIDIMSINKPDPRLWPTKLWAFCDTSQFRRHQELWQSYNGTIINSTAIRQQRPGTVQVSARQGVGFSRDLTKGFYIGRSTVYANLQTALWMEYDHIFIFGIDMDPEGLNGQLWFYGSNPDAPMIARKDRFKLEAEHYAYAADDMSDHERAKYTFCSAYNPWDFVQRFNRLDHRLAVNNVLSRYGD